MVDKTSGYITLGSTGEPGAAKRTSGALAGKLAKVLGEVGYVQKDGKNKFHNYSYITEAALTETIRPLLAKHNIFVFTSIESQETFEEVMTRKGDREIITGVTLLHTFMDGDTGETFSVRSQGQGVDGGDKGVYKAVTGAMKYFLYKNFMVATGDDPENDGGGSTTARRTQQGGEVVKLQRQVKAALRKLSADDRKAVSAEAGLTAETGSNEEVLGRALQLAKDKQASSE